MTPVAVSPRERKLAYAAWIVICVGWGTTYLAIRIALESVPVALMGGLRWTAAGVMLVAALPLLGERIPPLRTWGSISVAGFLMVVIGNGGVVWAEQYVASGLAAVVVAIIPFWTILVEALLPGGEPLRRRTLAGLVIGFMGIVVLVWPEIAFDRQSGRLFAAGLLALQLAGLGWALGTSYTRRNATAATPLSAAAMQMLIAGVMMMAIGTAMGEWSRLSFTTRSASALIYLTLVGSVLSYTSYAYALKYLPLSLVSQYAYVNPLIAVVLGSLVLQEPFSVRTIGAAALVFAGIAVVRSTSRHTVPAKASQPAA